MSPATSAPPRPAVTKTATPAQPDKKSANNPGIQKLIQRGRSEAAPPWTAFALSLLTGLLFWASFPPLEWSFLGWVAIVPLLLLVRLPRKTRWMYTGIALSAILSHLALLQWLRLGDPTMYPAWGALSIYMGLYFPVFVGLCRTAVQRLRVPLVIAAPALWVGLEYLRATLMTGFGWYALSHTQYRWIELIQISDLCGAYGVTFLMMLVASALTTLVPVNWLQRFRLLASDTKLEPLQQRSGLRGQVVGVTVALLAFASALGYGYYRRAEYRELLADTEPGPRVALVQGNFTAAVKHDPSEYLRIFRLHHYLTGQAVKHQPDLIVWPESMYRSPLLELSDKELSDEHLAQIAPRIPVEEWRKGEVSANLAEMSQMANAAMIIGVDAFVADADRVAHYNSAAFVRPYDHRVNSRYDKMHRVVFGEYIPLRDELPWLQSLTPFSDGFGIQKGDTFQQFEYGRWSMAPLICFEDTVPHLVHRLVRACERDGKQLSVLVNVTNDGWFHPKTESDKMFGSSASEQHLITSIFRTVECRTPMVRSVNTGVSAFISGEGVILEPELLLNDDTGQKISMRDENGRWHEQFNGLLVSTVPADPRQSGYVQWGDWFAQTCAAVCLLMLLAPLVLRLTTRKPAEEVPAAA